MSRLVIVSNRVADPGDKKAQAGGLAVALQSALREHGGIWFGWSGKITQQSAPNVKTQEVGNVTYATVDLDRQSYRQYYSGFANRVLWPLFHYRLDLTAFERVDFKGYIKVNRMFLEQLQPHLRDDDLVWIHDYHLIPLGENLRESGHKNSLGFFLHTPFPALEVIRGLPTHREIVKALCAYDVVGFQTENDLRAFQDYVVHELDGEILDDNMVIAQGRLFKAQAFPISLDPEEFQGYGRRAVRSAHYKRLKTKEGSSWLVGVDRLDYSKGIPERLRSYERLLERYPGYQGKVNFLQVTPASRSEVPEYKLIRNEIETLAGNINGRYAQFDWVPVNYICRSLARTQLAAFYRASAIGLVTPLRDGMNLVAKEYVACQNPKDPGVLVLSSFAGAAHEMDAALIVNPMDLDAVADAIARGLEMPLEERVERWDALMGVLQANTLADWRDKFIGAMHEVQPQG
ncbi:alpha,alpha-trehalose-phosphate synthase (UDP-forming) [Magnetospira sp. QH-2]|uniref:alpha,alpha-trehalose-phosphate synthase (UDP-forming) n=1 Tax=Magnetospira sp. (strain QH-2) TaxID=1288970 RepID=UPI0003E812C5|nr:alpha,alpha-trehalose-phosphate synthase (UDP-forming) [Magnetospira sp. QH-2]CCQ73508.1 GT20 : Trehalose-6-phosphate synthase [Magnetospira sp. QH-2]